MNVCVCVCVSEYVCYTIDNNNYHDNIDYVVYKISMVVSRSLLS